MNLETHELPSAIVLRSRNPRRCGESIAVVIDVLRAFTTSRRLLECGLESLTLVAGISEARLIRTLKPNAILIGEQSGVSVTGFDFDNSPSLVSSIALGGKEIFFRTTNGVPALLAACEEYDVVLAASLRDADAIAKRTIRLMERGCVREVHLICSDPSGEEDWACARYLAASITQDSSASRQEAMVEVETSAAARRLVTRLGPQLAASDIRLAVEQHEGNFVQQAQLEPGRVVLKKVNIC